jgi:hypothetical protein
MWTEGLQQQTRELFQSMNGSFMKHFGDSRFGLCIFIDGKYVITDREESEDIWEYDSIGEMITDGWAID